MCIINTLLLSILIIIPLSITQLHAIENCSESKKNEVLQTISQTDSSVYLDCHLTLNEDDTITKKILLQGESASNVKFDCNNALIDLTVGINAGIFSEIDDAIVIQSTKETDNNWSVPQNITIKDCEIKGSIRLIGMGSDAQDIDVKASSLTTNHTERSNHAAPHHIKLINLDIEAISRPPVYFSPGVNHVELKQSNLHGASDSVAVYLDAESNYNEILDNTVEVDTAYQLMSLDGSAHNKIENNYFILNDNGGIYLYRNCGEAGTVRHQEPSFNRIKANYFTYSNISENNSNNPAIYISANNGQQSYCADDDEAQLNNTSSTDDNDNAASNTIKYNQFLNVSPDELIVFGSLINDEELNEATTYANITVSDFRPDAKAEIIDFECLIATNSEGCYKYLECPEGKVNAANRAACNLEHGTVSSVDLPNWRHINIMRQSDTLPDSECLVNGVSAYLEDTHTHITGSNEADTYIGCKEHDNNGGDCHILGQQICL